MDPPPEHPGSTSSRLRARPAEGLIACALPAGCTALGLTEGRDGLLHVPVAATSRPSPLVVLLHGAGSSASAALMLLADLTEAHGLILLVPDSRASSWDFLRGGYGPDMQFIDRALAHVFEHCPIDPARVALVGFSDGASYALSLGIANGDLFTHLVAFSPGFAAAPRAGPARRRPRPRLRGVRRRPQRAARARTARGEVDGRGVIACARCRARRGRSRRARGAAPRGLKLEIGRSLS